MTCTGYKPMFQAQLDGTRYQGVNCNCASAGMACDDDTCGVRKPSSSQVRFWTRDTFGGTTLAEVDAALAANTPTRLDVRYRYPWSEFARRVNAGASAILQGWYAPIRDSRYGGSETFGGNHSVFVTPGLVTMDPLADGRRSGIYKYHAEPYPEALLRTFAARLNLDGRPDEYRPLGDGLCYAAFTRDNDADYAVTIRPLKGETYRTFSRYFVSNGRITGHETRRTRGFTAPCSPPANTLTQSGNARVSLVRIQKSGSSYNGFYVSSRWSD